MLFPHRDSIPSLNFTRPNRWDWALLPLVLGVLAALAFAAGQMNRPFAAGQTLSVSLDAAMLPYYLLRTMLRMLIALACSLLFTLVVATLAAKFRAVERVVMPLLDVLQSVPILGFQAIAIAPFIALFPGSLLGVECAAIFAIFTSQAWNMAFSLYQSIKTVPTELSEAATMFRLSGWQRFWRLELPFAIPGLLWNMMMSMSGGWFFLVAAEAISVANQDIKLPGIGSYIATAIDAENLHAIFYAIAAMFAGILVYDQLFFRPLLAWADKFRFEESQSETATQSWVLDFWHRTRWLRAMGEQIWRLLHRAAAWFPLQRDGISPPPTPDRFARLWAQTGLILLFTVVAGALLWLMIFVHQAVAFPEVLHVLWLACLTLLRVMVLIVLASLFWVPVSVWIGLRPLYSQKIQAAAQFLAAFPVNLIFPLAVYLLVTWRLNPNIWLSPLMIFGTQWYIVFNVIAAASTLPNELRLASDNLGLKGWLKWKRVYLPAVFPGFVTGAVTAAGGSWNASIVAEYVTWGKTTLIADGLGSYIAQTTAAGDFHRIALGIGVMCLFVMLMNRFFWHRLYRVAEEMGR